MLTRRVLAVTLAALVAAGAAAGCTQGGDDPRPAPSASPSDPFAPASKADLAAKIDERLPVIKDVPPERTAEYHALTTACIDLARMDRALTDEVAARLGVTAEVRADLRTAAGQCGSAPAEAGRTLRRVVGALRAG